MDSLGMPNTIVAEMPNAKDSALLKPLSVVRGLHVLVGELGKGSIYPREILEDEAVARRTRG
jgi:hypothetical protein